MDGALPVNAQTSAKSRHFFITFSASAGHDLAGAVI
jgi:hypothetical protein